MNTHSRSNDHNYASRVNICVGTLKRYERKIISSFEGSTNQHSFQVEIPGDLPSMFENALIEQII